MDVTRKIKNDNQNDKMFKQRTTTKRTKKNKIE